MKRITLNVDLSEARDLLERVPRACLACARDEVPYVEPVALLVQDHRYLVGLAPSASGRLTVGDEVVLLVDEGVQFFDLRAVYVRGDVRPLVELEGSAGELSWFEVRPTRAVAWDYARIREQDDEP